MDIKYVFMLLLMPLCSAAISLDMPLSISNNLPCYIRDRGCATRCISHPLSREGMNTFSASKLTPERAAIAYYAAMSYLRYSFQSEMQEGYVPHDFESSFLPKTSFDVLPNMDFPICGVKLSEMNVVGSAFEVRNRVATNTLSCVLLSFRNKQQYLFSVYYVENNGIAHVSFIEAAQNFDLLGEESYYPFLTEEEGLKQQQFLSNFNAHRFRERHLKPISSCKVTNDVEFAIDGL
ncbi:MAG: hypothetical protein IKO72_15510 [Kiritimatiellae bacterium]|nr:hypothetical protein [Kiritimatiellia bacterium]